MYVNNDGMIVRNVRVISLKNPLSDNKRKRRSTGAKNKNLRNRDLHSAWDVTAIMTSLVVIMSMEISTL